MRLKTTLLAGLALQLSAGGLAYAQTCTPADIGIDKLGSRMDSGYIFITGRILNKCAHATGVQLKITLYNTNGDILTVHDTWPASISNIPAKSDFPFEDMIRAPGTGFKKFDVRVIRTNVWRER